MSKRLFSTILFFISIFPLFSENLDSQQLFSEEILQTIESGKSYTREFFQSNEVAFSPLVNKTFYIENPAFNSVTNPTMIIEKIYFIPHNKIKNNFEQIFKNFHKISSLTDVEYFSQSKGKMRTLFEQSYTIESKSSAKQIPDIIPKLSRNEFEIFQEDTSFGDMFYNVQSDFSENCINLSLLSNSHLKLGVFKLIDPEKLQITATLFKTDKGYIFYGTLRTDYKDKLGIMRKRSDSMHNRLQAIYDWFAKENII
ncbi:MAG: hypothetical protein JXR63_12425 [Spirochaetales bacterium]|nr:hypothetical protein [Spirochaetales bacterium]